MIQVTGDTAALAALVEQIASAPDIINDAAKQFRSILEGEYQRGFAEQRDPNGTAWLANKNGRAPIGLITGALSRPDVRVTGLEVTVRPSPRYAEYFQRKRAIVPGAGEAGAWGDPLETNVEKLVEKHFR